MDATERAQARSVLRMIRQDIPEDIARRDGQDFTGPNVAQWIGETLAIVDALAAILLLVVGDE